MIKALNAYEKEDLVKREGEDFLFLFDLIAHTCGLPATLRVLSYTAPKFERLCQPVVNPAKDLELTETTLRVAWSPAPLQAPFSIFQSSIPSPSSLLLPFLYCRYIMTYPMFTKKMQNIKFSSIHLIRFM